MSQIDIGNTKIEVDQDGFLSAPEVWNEEIAKALAEHEGIDELNQSKLDIVLFLREYYQKYSSFPILGYVCKKVHAGSRSCITDEFVDPMKAWKIAGLPKPPQVFFTSFDGKHYAANPFY
ncbi:MAG: TusE/DsrC/DsvC family sulfur relay protein [Desulforhopalus sp.]|nr:TusE/DsrC/DsvC family sulfur relay protein [Desulforhopalus sp.]